jgi:pimeloyl-ACP methyl ester carboxylesterase
MFSPSRMAARVGRIGGPGLTAELAVLKVPTLVVTGDAALDRVVPVHRTHEYLEMWPHAIAATLPATGHLGLITRPDEFARLVVPFVERNGAGSQPQEQARRRIV